MATDTINCTPTELAVEQWRIEQLAKLGFSTTQIALCLIDNIDYHDAAALIDSGCSRDIALDILTS
jgi:hypothetical protein